MAVLSTLRRLSRDDRRSWITCAFAATCLVILVLVPGVQPSASGASDSSLAGSQGIVTSLPSGSDPVTVAGRGAFANLQVTVNQTANLVNQAVSVSWTGATPTAQTSTDTHFEQNYLQIFQCWGTPDPTDPLYSVNPGPSPTQCEFGGESTTPTSSYPITTSGFEYTRVLAATNWSDYGNVDGCVDPSTKWDVEPFDAVDGTVVCQQDNGNYLANGQPFWLNPYFSFNTSNEIDFARTYPTPNGSGEGSQLFQVDTGLEAPGLGCGQSVEAVAGGGDEIPQCWLVIVPRGTPDDENPTGLNQSSVVTSPLSPDAWSNRIAIPLTFQPLGNSCGLGGNTQRIDGGELATAAVGSWQSTLCSSSSATSFDYTETGDNDARGNIVNPSYGSAGMSAFTEPISPAQVSAADPVVYAPITLSGVVVAFNIDRVPIADAADGYQPQPDEVPLQGTQVEHVYLTPRLVAKLLTESYPDELQDVPSTTTGYAWTMHNPLSLVTDPDFLQYNPEFSLLTSLQGVDSSTLVVEEPDSDAATELWDWVLSDPAAAAWLNGQPDPWGMNVNPLYSTNPSVNSSGAPFGSPVPDSYPKSDPYCLKTGDSVGTPPALAPPLCVQDWSPYALTMQAAAEDAAAANDGAKTELNPNGTVETPWSANGPQETGTQFILSVTDSASAAQYGLQTASLSRDGDDGSSPVFVEPNEQSLLAGEQAMVPSAVPDVLQPDLSTTASGAYPLPILTYTATTPESLSTSSRQAYSSFLQYAAGAGQVIGTNPGQLPLGYAPLPSALQKQTLSAAATILNPPSTATTTPPLIQSSSPVVVNAPKSNPPSESQILAPVSAAPSSVSVQVIVPADARTQSEPVASLGGVRWVIPIVLIVGLFAILVDAVIDPIERSRRKKSPKRRELALTPRPEPGAYSRAVFEPW